MIKNLLLTGRPGVGKTSILQAALASCSLSAGGFYTREIREEGRRVGFELISLEGERTILAHARFSSPYKVSKYSVNLDNLDKVGVASILTAIREKEVIVIDEIGRMELFSELFQESVKKAFDSPKRVLGTIMQKYHPFAEQVKSRPDTQVWTVTSSNRAQIVDALIQWLKGTS